MNYKAIIFDIQRFSIHDGPGIRTTVFLKGCSLKCFWCHNPEGINPKKEILFYESKCIFCGECIIKCSHSAHTIEGNKHIYNRNLCVLCEECVSYCYSNALEIAGKILSVDEVFEEILKDKNYYISSGGGITLSGGEPLLHSEFSYFLLKKCKENNINTAVETSGNCRWDQIETILPVTDLIMMDIKHINPEKHKIVTGISNNLILENAQKLSEKNINTIFRVPIVPTVNDTEEEIIEIAKFVDYLSLIRKKFNPENTKEIKLEFLPFHKLAGDKYKSLNYNNLSENLNQISKERINTLKNVALEYYKNID